ncbi:MAG TPA: hypothetical protein VER98_01285 [Terriglobia bacterium]|nr:hypothetical protein [Terriglobia bacterium]
MEGMMTGVSSTPGHAFRKPRFAVGDRVIAVGPGNQHHGQSGVVVEVVQANPDYIYRYRVQFSEGSTWTFFGFELENLN